MEERLTYLQKVALKGEIASALSSSLHDGDLKYRIYFMLKEIEKDLKPVIFQYIKESAKLSDEALYKIYMDVAEDKVPVKIWVEKAVSDILFLLNAPDISYGNIC